MKKYIAIILTIAGLAIIIFPLVTVLISYFQIEYTTLEDVEQRYRINIPDTATNIHIDYQAVRDTWVRIRFDISNEDFFAFENMIDDICVEYAHSFTRSPIVYREDDDWWINENESRLSDKICFGSDGKIYAYYRRLVSDNAIVVFLYMS